MGNVIKTAMNCVDKYHLSRRKGVSTKESIEICEMFLSGRVDAHIINQDDALEIILHIETIAMFDK